MSNIERRMSNKQGLEGAFDICHLSFVIRHSAFP